MGKTLSVWFILLGFSENVKDILVRRAISVAFFLF